MSRRHAFAALVSGAVVSSVAGPAAGQVAFRLLTERQGFPWWTRVTGLSADGRVVVGHTTAAPHGSGFRWSADRGMQYFDPITVDGEVITLGFPTGVSADGSVIVGPATGGRFYRWVEEEGVTLHSDSFAWDRLSAHVSQDGTVVVGEAYFLDSSLPYRWTAVDGVHLMLPFPTGVNLVRVNGVSGDGRVVLGHARRNPTEFPWIWTVENGYTILPTPDLGENSQGRAYAASFDGSVIVGEARTSSGTTAAMWRSPYTQCQFLGDLEGGPSDGTAYACSDDGSVVVGFSTGAGGLRATIWPSGEPPRAIEEVLLTDFGLDIGERTLSLAIGVSADGRVIAGDSYPSDGLYDPWIARLDPTADCPCYFDHSSPAIDERDVAAFVSAWFEQDPATDFNGDALFDIHDILDFLDCWFPAAAAQPCSSDPGTGS